MILIVFVYFKNVEFFNTFTRELEAENIVGVMENVHENNSEFIRDLIGAINSKNFGACIDIGHVNLHSFLG